MTMRRTLSAGRVWSVAALAGALGATALAAPEPAAEPPTERERTGLAHLHRRAVLLFIDREGFGFSRMGPPPLEDVLGPPKSAADAGQAVQAFNVAPRVAPSDRERTAPHFSIEKRLQDSAFNAPPPAAGKVWAVKEVRLIGLTKNPDPVVYLDTGPADGAADGKKREVKTRKLDAFEEKAVEVIRGGGELVQAEKRGGSLRALSGIYAGRRCMGCHERPGEMLGAFSYRLAVEDAKEAKAVGPVRP